MSELYTLEQCARKAGVSLSTIKREVVSGKLVATRLRGAVRIAPGDWEEYLRKCRSEGMGALGKSGFSTKAKESPDLLQAVRMLPNLSALLGTGSRIVELDERRRTRSKKRSTAG